MSIEIVLVPLAFAAIVAAREAKVARTEAGRQMVTVATRMRDEHLLQRALADTGATVTATPGEIVASWTDLRGRFTKDADGIWAVHLSGDVTYERASALVAAVDAAYGRHVQTAVLARLKEKAPSAGMDIESETVEDDQSVTLVLTVREGA